MRPFRASKSTELEATSIARSLPTRFCDHCHLSTLKANPRCIHCRCLLQTTHLLADRIETRVS